MQRVAYDIVFRHFEDSSSKDPLHLIIIGVAGTGKSYRKQAAPFCSKFSYQIGDAAYLREHLDYAVNMNKLRLFSKNFIVCIDLCSKIIRSS